MSLIIKKKKKKKRKKKEKEKRKRFFVSEMKVGNLLTGKMRFATNVPFGDGDGSGTPPPTAAAGEGADGGVGAGELRFCAATCEW